MRESENLKLPLLDPQDLVRRDNINGLAEDLDKKLLKKNTAELYGEGANAVPDKVFRVIARSMFGSSENIYRWVRTKRVYSVVQSDLQTTTQEAFAGTSLNGASVGVQYADSYTVDGNGQFVLDDPTTITISYDNPDQYETILRGKYFAVRSKTSYLVGPFSEILLGDASLDFASNKDSDGDYYVSYKGYFKLTQSCKDICEIVSSPDSTAYPVADDGWTYETLAAVPAQRGYAKIATGDYIGTGKFGADTPNKLTFPGRPELVIVFKGSLTVRSSSSDIVTGFYYGFFWTAGCAETAIDLGAHLARAYFTYGADSLSWYGLNADAQLNSEGVKYTYFALYD